MLHTDIDMYALHTQYILTTLLLQLVLALRYIHKDRHIIHRDLTASNVMLTNNDHLMLSE